MHRTLLAAPLQAVACTAPCFLHLAPLQACTAPWFLHGDGVGSLPLQNDRHFGIERQGQSRYNHLMRDSKSTEPVRSHVFVRRVVSSFLLCCSLTIASINLSGCGQKTYDSPSAVFEAAQAASAKRDMEGVMNCLTEESQQTFVEMLVGFFGMMKGFAGLAGEELPEPIAKLDKVMKKHGLSDKALEQMEDESYAVKDKAGFVGDFFKAMNVPKRQELPPLWSTLLQPSGKLEDISIHEGAAVGTAVDGDTHITIGFIKVGESWLIDLSASGEPVTKNEPAAAVSVSGNFEYEIQGDTATITSCNKNVTGSLIIPVTIENKPAASIGNGAFQFCIRITDVTIPDSVTSIGDSAFRDCSSLTSITIPDSVTSIGEAAFRGCTSLTSITILNGVTSIGDQAFLECSRLIDITIPDSVTSIGDQAFSFCTNLTSITIPDSVTSIGDQAFLNCSSLTSITIPDSVTSIGYAAFCDCKSLTAVTFLGDTPKVGQEVFLGATPTIYRNPETKGWGDTFAGRPVKLISEKP